MPFLIIINTPITTHPIAETMETEMNTHSNRTLYCLFLIFLFPVLNLFASEDGGPYAVDDQTVLLMHFDNSLK